MESPPHTPRNHKKLLFTINFPNASFKRRISFSNIEFSIVFNIIFYCCIILKIILKFFFSSCLSHIARRLFGEDLFVFLDTNRYEQRLNNQILSYNLRTSTNSIRYKLSSLARRRIVSFMGFFKNINGFSYPLQKN